MPIFCYSTEVILANYYHPRHLGIELLYFYPCLAKSKIATMVREFKFVYSQAAAEPAA